MIIIFILIFGSFCFLTAQEKEDLELLQSLTEEENDSEFLDALQKEDEIIAAQNEIISQENEWIEQEKEKIKKKKRQNKKGEGGYLGTGLNFPLNICTNNFQIPLGVSLFWQGNREYIAFKFNCNFDFIKYSEEAVNFSSFLSLGLSPIHNEFCFVGLYGTWGNDVIDNYSYFSYGVSGLLLFNFSKKWSAFINCDATYRNKGEYLDKEKNAPYPPSFDNSWRVCPSIGICYNYLWFR